MAKQLNADEESILKRQARRRLIGAVALTAAVVVILPMVFDGEPPSATVNDIELRIPDKDKVGEFNSGSSVPMAEASSAVAAAPATVVEPAVATPVMPVQKPAESGSTQETKIELPHTEVAKPATIEAQPKVEAKPAEHTHAVPHSGFAVQVGAFSNADTAKSLQEKLDKQGFHVYTEKIGGHVRVRVGSFSTHESAEKVRHKLEAQGLRPNVVNLGG